MNDKTLLYFPLVKNLYLLKVKIFLFINCLLGINFIYTTVIVLSLGLSILGYITGKYFFYLLKECYPNF